MRKQSLLLVSCRRQAILTTAIKKILGISLVCLCFAAQAWGQESETTDPLTWLVDDGVLTISGTGAMLDYSSGESPCYSDRSSITTVNIEDGVTTIGNYAFEDCSNLASITIPNSITTIGDSVFSSCTSLTNVTVLKTSPPTISPNTFSGFPLNSATLTVPQGSESAYEAAGGWTDFGTIVEEEAPATVAVTSVSLDQTSLDKTVGDPDVTLTATISPSNATNQEVEWSTDNSEVATVSTAGVVSFVGVGSTNITVTTVDGNKTATCDVTVAAATVAVTSVSLDQTSLDKTVGDSPVTLTATISPSDATNQEVSWSTDNSSVATVDNGVVNFVGAGSAVITVTTQDGNKTATCDVTVAAASSGIGGTTGLLTWSLEDGVLTISGTGAMPDYSSPSYAPWYSYGSDITTVNIEEGVTTIGNAAFYNCSSLNSVSIGSSVTTIENYAFNACSSLASITFPGSVTAIGFYVFSGCTSLRNVTVLITSPPQIDNNTFLGISLSSVTLTVPQGSKPDYQDAVGWKDFGTIVEDGEERNVVVEAPKPEGNKGVIEVSLNIPAEGSFSFTFTLTLPQGFTLDQSVTALADDLAADYQLDITPQTGNIWQFDIRPKSSQDLHAAATYRNLVNIAYTIEETAADGDHEVKLTDVELTMSDNTVIREDEIVVSVTTGAPAGIDKAAEGVAIRSASGKLYVDSPAAETVYIYSFTGKLLYTAKKAVGQAIFNAPSEKLLIVRGTSGWTRKLMVNY